MSPTEHDLRAALSDGEGGRPDPDRLIALGRARQARRRVQLLSTAAVVAVVASGAGVVTLVRGGGDSKSSNRVAGGSAQDQLGPASIPAARAANSAAAGGKAATPAVACPTTLPHYALPGGGSPGQFGADGPLFGKQVQTVIVCSYAGARTANSAAALAPARVALTGSRAAALAASLNDAAPSAAAPCPKDGLIGATRAFAILGFAADGKPLGTVVATYSATGCAAQVTNGTAVRYNWTPPSDLLPILTSLTPTVSLKPAPTSPPKMHGSPISS
jgi:hypothetical protein